MKKFFLILLTVFSTTLLCERSFAQFGPPKVPDAPEDTTEEIPVDVPLDGGLSILLAAGAGYGIKKIRDERKREQAGKK